MEKLKTLLSAETFDQPAFAEAVCDYVNNFSWNAEKTASSLEEFVRGNNSLDDRLFHAAIACILALGTAPEWCIDGRNEIAAAKCKELAAVMEKDDIAVKPEESFLRRHRTLQQSAISLFCALLDLENKEHQILAPNLCDKLTEYSDEYERWYRFPMI